MILLSNKEKLILEHYKQSLENQHFDEFDLIGFFIFIRSFIDKGTYPNIFEICDTIAHRERDKGRANTGIKNIIRNQYRTKNGSKKLEGAKGITERAWQNEWVRFGKDYSIEVNKSIIQDISLCVVSLLQDVQMQDDQHNIIAFTKIVKAQDALSVAITEGNGDSPFVIFFVARVATEAISDGIIDDAVLTIRENGKLRLMTDKNIFIV